MIDTDKMKAAFAATPLCQKQFVRLSKDGVGPSAMCAVSALVSFAGVQPMLLHKMLDECLATGAFSGFVAPVLRAEYGIPREITFAIPDLFDGHENEYRAVAAVLARCEAYNTEEAARKEAEWEDITAASTPTPCPDAVTFSDLHPLKLGA